MVDKISQSPHAVKEQQTKTNVCYFYAVHLLSISWQTDLATDYLCTRGIVSYLGVGTLTTNHMLCIAWYCNKINNNNPICKAPECQKTSVPRPFCPTVCLSVCQMREL